MQIPFRIAQNAELIIALVAQAQGAKFALASLGGLAER